MTMERTMVAPGLALFLATASGAALAGEPPTWLAGSWCHDENGVRIEERWLPAASNRMLGINQTLVDGRSTAFEFLRIEQGEDGVLRYLPQPGGREATPFAATVMDESHARFENPAHDFPQVIEYRRRGESLTATIAGPGENGEVLEISFPFERCSP